MSQTLNDPLAGLSAAERARLPVGVFDSGLGGLSVLREIRALMPSERLCYVADSGHVPYGDKTAQYIEQRAAAITGFLVDRPVKAIVVACNTATAAAAPALRRRYALPILGMEPAVKPAVAATRSGVVGVLATVGTLESARFAALLERFGSETRIVTQPCPGLVEQVEAAQLDTPETERLVARYAAPLIAAGADTLILGCTHYPFLRPVIERIVGPHVQLIDTGAAVARHLKSTLAASGLLAPGAESGDQRFWTTGDPAAAGRAIAVLWHPSATAEAMPGDSA